MLNLCAGAAPNLHECSAQRTRKIYAAGSGRREATCETSTTSQCGGSRTNSDEYVGGQSKMSNQLRFFRGSRRY